MNKYIQLILVGLLSIGLFACSQDDGKAAADKAGAMAEEAGDAVEDAAVATGEAVEDAAVATGKAIEEGAEATGEAIEDAAKNGRGFDFEGSMVEPIERFCRAFGARQTPYFTISKGRSPVIRGYRGLRKIIGLDR